MAEQTLSTTLDESPAWFRQRWGVIVIGFVVAFGTGLIFARVVESSPDWNRGLPWERALILASPRPLPGVIDALMMVVPWFGTNISLIPAIAVICWWLWKKRGHPNHAIRLGVVQLGSRGRERQGGPT